jgi:hypothetical protein
MFCKTPKDALSQLTAIRRGAFVVLIQRSFSLGGSYHPSLLRFSSSETIAKDERLRRAMQDERQCLIDGAVYVARSGRNHQASIIH